MKFGDLWLTLWKILAGTLAMAAAVAVGWRLVRAMHGADVIAVFGLIPLGVVVYGASLWFLKIEGRDELVDLVAKLRGKFGVAK